MGNPAAPAALKPSLDLRLGSLLARAGLLPREKLAEALARQATHNARLGELLVEMGVLDAIELNAVLALQQDLLAGRAEELIRSVSERLGALREGPLPAAGERLRLGQMLVQAGVIDERTLERAIARQRATGLKLGEALVQAGAISPDTLQAFLARQHRLVGVAVAAATLFAGVAPGPAIAAGSHQVNIQATVLRHAAISALRMPHSVQITQADAERGYVELAEPVEVELRSNDAHGLMLDFAVNSPQLRAVAVQATEGAELRSGGQVFVPKVERGLRTQSVSLRLRLVLAPDAAPGTIAHPFAVSLSPR